VQRLMDTISHSLRCITLQRMRASDLQHSD
jgi:hypothetical protein